jgi:alpha-D-xyloside xylohydrolase
MAESLRGGLSLSICGFGYWSHDIGKNHSTCTSIKPSRQALICIVGGFEGTPDTNLFKRWIQFGIFSSHSRLHGSGSYRVPWNFETNGDGGKETSEVMAKFTKLKSRLMPYIYSKVSL